MDAWRWVRRLAEELREEFGERLLFVGLQGSRLRGEERPDSDIDVMTVLDTLSAADLERVRLRIRRMPEAEKACGFICGREELRGWPAHESFAVAKGTAPVYGTLKGLLPPCTRQDIAAGVLIGASGLYHAVGHLCLYGGPDRAEMLYEQYKFAFFLLQSLYFLRTGTYIATRKELLPLLEGEERRILETGMAWERSAPERQREPSAYFDLLLQWSGRLLAEGIEGIPEEGGAA
ncbi:MAG TPA: nucleotidyltransferase domain-containing protein [Firmicutes bacterium]|nr:nucleotidyltransferase domain-containing protein [Bacillota bacterium]